MWQHGGAHTRRIWAWQVRLGTEDQTTTGHGDDGNGTDEKVKEELEVRHKGAQLRRCRGQRVKQHRRSVQALLHVMPIIFEPSGMMTSFALTTTSQPL